MKRPLLTTIGILVLLLVASTAALVLRAGSVGGLLHDLAPSDARAAGGEPKAGDVDPANGKRIKYWVAPMDPTYIRNEPGKSPMGMDLVPVYEEAGGEKEPTSTIRIDPVTVQNMGIRTGTVRRGILSKDIASFGTVTYNESRIHAVNLKFSGWIEKLHVDFLGEVVDRGQPLFDIYSPELVTAQEEFLLALDQLRRLGESPYREASDSARRLLEASRTRLRYWDLTDAQIRRLEETGRIRKAVTVFSPARGVVTGKKALPGHYVKAGEHQYEIADLSTVWVDVEVYEYELPWIRKGMEAEMTLSYIPGRRFRGRVLYVYPFVEPKTRTARLRLEFENPDRTLKPNMYANVRLTATLDRDSLLLPQEAVIDSGVRKIVFVSKGEGRFEPRQIEVGVETNDHRIQVLEGLEEGEQVVLSAQFMLDSESRLREAIQKMLAVKNGPSAGGADASDLDLDGISMEPSGESADDLDLTGITMEDG